MNDKVILMILTNEVYKIKINEINNIKIQQKTQISLETTLGVVKYII